MSANTKLLTSLVSNTELSKFLGRQQTIYTLTSPLLPSTMGVPSIPLVSEMQKTQKSVSLAATDRKRRKTFVARERNAEIVEKRPSSTDEIQKTQKTARRRPTKRKKRRKTLVVGRQNAEIAKKSLRYGGKSSIFGKIYPDTGVNR